MGIERRQRKIGAVPVRSIGDRRERAEVVDPVEVRRGERDVEPAEEEVDGVRVTRAEGRREGAADPGGC